MDLLAVVELRGLHLRIVSYEMKLEWAVYSRTCSVATTLSKLDRVNVDIVPDVFPGDYELLYNYCRSHRNIYFLDYKGTYSKRNADILLELLDQKVLREGDYFLITSCISPRIVHQATFMQSFLSSFLLYYGASAVVDREFRVRNHVDLLVELSFSQFTGYDAESNRYGLIATNLCKFKYKDSRAPMGVWLFRVDRRPAGNIVLPDTKFEEFPMVFAIAREEVLVPSEEPEGVNIFD